MPAPTYTTDLLVLRKTKLKETDLILTCLTCDGAQLRLVAKGARKPNSAFSSRLELFSCAHVLAARGKNLSIVKEAKLLQDNIAVRESLTRSAAASVLCELLSKATDVQLSVQYLYPMTCRALECMGGADEAWAGTIAAAACLKAFSYLGFQPELQRCVVCGGSIARDSGAQDTAAFSFTEGGVVCSACACKCNCVSMSALVLDYARFLLFSPFSKIVGENFNEGESTGAVCGDDDRVKKPAPAAHKTTPVAREFAPAALTTSVLQLCNSWARTQLSVNLKSMNFLLSLDA